MKKLPIISALVLGIAFVGMPAFAADSDLVEETVITETLDDLGVDAGDGLIDDLVADVDLTELDEEVVDVVDDALDSGEDAGEILDDTLDEVLDENEVEQDETWVEFGDIWHTAFEAVKSDFDACRAADATKGVKDCAAQFTSTLHVAHAEAMVAWSKAQLDLVATLPIEEQEAATAEILAAIARAESRLATVTERETEKAIDVQSRLDEQAERAADKVNKGKHGKGNAGSTEGDSTDTTTDTTEGEEDTTKPTKPDNDGGNSDNGKGGGNSNKPEKPGKPGKDN